MISQPLTIIRTNKLGKPYVQNTDPSSNNQLAINDIWLNPTDGTLKTWNGSAWEEMQFGESALMDDCISNRVIAGDISASKITTGILQSQDGSVFIDLITGEAVLNKLSMGGEIEGNVIAMSTNELTRVRLRGREDGRDVTAGIIFEQRETTDSDEWENAGQIYFGYTSRHTFATLQAYVIGVYNPNKPTMGYYQGSDDGYVWRAVSSDYLKASMQTFHGMRLVERNSLSDSFTDVVPVMNAIGNCMSGTAIVVDGIVTCTYGMNEVMRLDFNLKVTTSGSGSSAFGISPTLLRTLNSNIPTITPISGGTLQMFNSSGALSVANIGASMIASNGLWTPSRLVSGSQTAFSESDIASGYTLVGTCYGTYSMGD